MITPPGSAKNELNTKTSPSVTVLSTQQTDNQNKMSVSIKKTHKKRVTNGTKTQATHIKTYIETKTKCS